MINNIKQSVQRSECRHIIKIKIKVIIDIYLLKKKKNYTQIIAFYLAHK